MNHPPRRKRQQGLTLIELLVVLFILAAVAGVAIGIVPNVQKRTHGATSAASIRAGESALTAELFTGGQLGGGFDALVTAAGAVPDYVGNSGATGFAPVALDDDIVDALNELGIDRVHPAAFADSTALGDSNATFEGHNYGAQIDIIAGATDNIAALGATSVTELEETFNLATGQFDEIFAFGLGSESDLVGLNRSFKVAPVHTPGEGSAATSYARYAILVGYETGGEATYIGMTCIDDGEEFKTIDGNLGEFYEATTN